MSLRDMKEAWTVDDIVDRLDWLDAMDEARARAARSDKESSRSHGFP